MNTNALLMSYNEKMIIAVTNDMSNTHVLIKIIFHSRLCPLVTFEKRGKVQFANYILNKCKYFVFCVRDQSILLSELTSSIFFSILNEIQRKKIIITHTHKQTYIKKKRRIKKMMRRNVTTNKPTKIAGGKTQEQLYTRACAHTYER
jgi:hypothetical protein